MTTDDLKMNDNEGGGLATDNGSLQTDESEALLNDLGGDVPDTANLDMLLDVNLQITVELGRTRMKFRDVLNLSNGSVVELSRMVSEPVDILVNGALLASGEVVVVDDHFAIRISKLLNRVERLKRVL
ncbi:MAG: flagellar motor switch protein FliN [bacterium]|nr:flagellar motor switch protein FliN [bacterium]